MAERAANDTDSARTLPRNGCSLHYWVHGRLDSPFVILTHGASVDHHTWGLQVPVLAERYGVVTWDVRGHGASRPMGGAFSLREATADLIAILDELGVDRAALVGQSMGGMIAQDAALLQPGRVSALVGLGCVCITLPLSLLDALLLRLSTPLLRWYPERLLISQIASRSTIRPDVQRYLRDAASQIPKRDFIEIWSALADYARPAPGYRYTGPELLLRGQFDHLGRVAQQMPRWAARDPRARYVVIPDAGHVANQDNPLVFNDVLLDFLGKAIG